MIRRGFGEAVSLKNHCTDTIWGGKHDFIRLCPRSFFAYGVAAILPPLYGDFLLKGDPRWIKFSVLLVSLIPLWVLAMTIKSMAARVVNSLCFCLYLVEMVRRWMNPHLVDLWPVGVMFLCFLFSGWREERGKERKVSSRWTV